MGLMDRLTGKVTVDQFAAELVEAIRAAGCGTRAGRSSG